MNGSARICVCITCYFLRKQVWSAFGSMSASRNEQLVMSSYTVRERNSSLIPAGSEEVICTRIGRIPSSKAPQAEWTKAGMGIALRLRTTTLGRGFDPWSSGIKGRCLTTITTLRGSLLRAPRKDKYIRNFRKDKM